MFTPCQVALYRPGGHACDVRYAVDAEIILVEEGDARPFGFLERGEGAVDVHLAADVGLLRAGLRVHADGVQRVRLVPAAKIVIKNVICNTIEPGAEVGQPVEGCQRSVCLEEGVLCQVIAQCGVAARLVEEEAADG